MSDLAQTSCTCAPIVVNMHKKFELNRTKIKGAISCLNKKWSGILALFTFKSKFIPLLLQLAIYWVATLAKCAIFEKVSQLSQSISRKTLVYQVEGSSV